MNWLKKSGTSPNTLLHGTLWRGDQRAVGVHPPQGPGDPPHLQEVSLPALRRSSDDRSEAAATDPEEHGERVATGAHRHLQVRRWPVAVPAVQDLLADRLQRLSSDPEQEYFSERISEDTSTVWYRYLAYGSSRGHRRFNTKGQTGMPARLDRASMSNSSSKAVFESSQTGFAFQLISSMPIPGDICGHINATASLQMCLRCRRHRVGNPRSWTLSFPLRNGNRPPSTLRPIALIYSGDTNATVWIRARKDEK